jgi:serine-type D-Ala-D-Ala carboxypeptidase/endopeptidase (penicillin-binding protein 4)
MKRIGLVGICISSLISQSAWGICRVDLQKQVEVQIQSSSLRSARVGVFASKLDDFINPIVNIDGDKYFIPASNLKLFTTAAALELLGADYQIRTSLGIDENKQIWVRGGGDPSFSEGALKTLVQTLGKYLNAKGIKAIAPDIKTISEFSGSGLGIGWQWQDLQEYYGAIANAFIVNENVLDWTITPTKINQPVKFSWDRPDLAQGWEVDNRAITVSSSTNSSLNSLKVERSLSQKKLVITGNFPQNSPPELGANAIPDPELHFLRILRTEITKQGIKFTNQIKSEAANQSIFGSTEVAVIPSPTLAELIKVTNKESNNLYAESLLRRIGTLSKDVTESDVKGIDLILKFLASKGISEVVIKDGSGLSSLNLVTPRAIAQLLSVMSSNQVFRNSLAIAGVDGTLKNRFKSVTAENVQPINMQAKTGTLTGVNALSGYLKPLKYPELVFSIVINNSTLSNPELVKNVDAIALMLSTVEECP